MLHRNWLLELGILLGVGLRDRFRGQGAIAWLLRSHARGVIYLHVLETLHQGWFAVVGAGSYFSMCRVWLGLMVLCAAAPDALFPSLGCFLRRLLGYAIVREPG